MEYWIYRLPLNSDWKFRSWKTNFNLKVCDYVLVYVGKIDDGVDILNRIYEKLNIDYPADYKLPSLSISDVVGLRKHDGMEYYYVDRFGFKRIWEGK